MQGRFNPGPRDKGGSRSKDRKLRDALKYGYMQIKNVTLRNFKQMHKTNEAILFFFLFTASLMDDASIRENQGCHEKN